MNNKLLHTPEGVRDLYGQEYAAKVRLQEELLHRFHLYGYEDIQTPTFEFFDIFSSNIGTIPSNELFKFFDKEGNTLVLRPDFTPSIARCVAKYYMDETMPVRFCYQGNTFMNGSDLQGRLKESTQIGVELINEDRVEADAEMIALMIESLKSAGLKEFQVTIGNVEYFKGLCEECGIDPELELELRDSISNKNYFLAETTMQANNIPDEVQDKILKVTEMFGSIDKILNASKLVKNERSINAINRLKALHDILSKLQMDRYLTYDIGMLSKYHYYTGVIFKAYSYGTGDAIGKGGRYDNLLSEFGKEAPAIGFAIVLDDLYLTLRRQGLDFDAGKDALLLLYEKDQENEAYQKAEKYRKDGIRTILMQKDALKTRASYEQYAQSFGYKLEEV
ncbi:MAG: ATP phosphoribosyltransferase regulatory subunit [Lachnospiraceae bacterium]|nr:ATP phosphoribosyltransferase regulatory subunit [Lachnospiraceae bacterium]